MSAPTPWVEYRALAESLVQGAADALSRTLAAHVDLGVATACQPEQLVAGMPEPIQALEMRFAEPLDDVMVLVSPLREDALRAHAATIAEAMLTECAALVGTTPRHLGEVTYSDLFVMDTVDQAADMCEALYREVSYLLEVPGGSIQLVIGTDFLRAAASLQAGDVTLNSDDVSADEALSASLTPANHGGPSALDLLDAELAQVQDSPTASSSESSSDLNRGAWTTMLSGVDVELSAELGRTELELGRIADLTRNSVLTLDQLVDEPVTVFVNGVAFATARLVVVDGEYGIEILDVLAHVDATTSIELAA